MESDIELMSRFLAHCYFFNMRYFDKTDHLTVSLLNCSFACEFAVEDVDKKIFRCTHCDNRYQLKEPTWRETLQNFDKIHPLKKHVK